MESKLEIDDVTPSSYSHLIERRNDLILQHGWVATRMHFDTIEAMDLDAFVKTEVPKLRQAADTLTVVKDMLNQSVSLILDDQVIRYHLTNMEEVSGSELVKLLKTDEKKTFIPNIHYPLVGYVDDLEYRRMTVLVENKSIIYRSKSFNENFEEKIYLPPIWFQVKVNRAGSVLGVSICAVPEKAHTVERTTLKKLPLPNIHQNGEVCLGSSAVKATYPSGFEITDGIIIQSAMDQMFNSFWNTDLLSGHLDSVLGKAYESVTGDRRERFDKLIARNSAVVSVANLIRILAVLMDPNGWKLLNYESLGYDHNGALAAKTFLGV